MITFLMLVLSVFCLQAEDHRYEYPLNTLPGLPAEIQTLIILNLYDQFFKTDEGHLDDLLKNHTALYQTCHIFKAFMQDFDSLENLANAISAMAQVSKPYAISLFSHQTAIDWLRNYNKSHQVELEILLINLANNKIQTAADIIVMNSLLQIGVSSKVSTETHQTPLMMACAHGHYYKVKILLKHHAVVHFKDNQSYTALHFAAENGHDHIIQLLLDHHADPKAKTIFDHTPLELAQQNKKENVVKILKNY